MKVNVSSASKKYVIDPQFEELLQPLLDLDVKTIHDILHKFSLLRYEKLFKITNNNVINAFYNKNYLNSIVLAASQCTASNSGLVQEILAAGFPVYDLARKLITIDQSYPDVGKLIAMDNHYDIIDYYNQNKYYLYSLLPHISENALASKDVFRESKKCVLSNKVPKVPVVIHGKLYDFEVLVWFMNKDKFFEIDGKKAIEVIDDAILDMKYIKAVHNLMEKYNYRTGLLKIMILVISTVGANFLNERETDESKKFTPIIYFIAMLCVFQPIINYLENREIISANSQAYNGDGNLPNKIASRFKDELNHRGDKCHALTFWKQVVCKNNGHNNVNNAKQNTEYNNTPAFRSILNM